ncbi:hypothetical protein BDN67DRAFT_969786 [Paxillus ammoniavirescens]|nr:hypothetical protein BDN67DRAFT_969786 [Paxillus ammoniavirescens]
MKTFLTLLAAITYLSAYTLVGVHATCAVCTPAVDGISLTGTCTNNKGITSEQVPEEGANESPLHLQRAYSLIYGLFIYIT